jgi:spoIIIJ-associated protein
MIEVVEKEGKTEEELLSSIDLDNVHYKIEEIPGKLFKGKKYLIKTIEKEAIRNFIKDFINNLGLSMNKKINIEIRYSDDCYSVMLICEDNSILIGKDGRTLNSIQLLLHQAINNKTGFNIRVNVDAANYKTNKEKRLEREIKLIAKEVCDTKIEVKLDPMNSYERRIVHNVIGNFNNLKSESFGEDPSRYIIISYKED